MLNKIENEKSLVNNHILYSIKADFELMNGNINVARELLAKALELTENSTEKLFLKKKFDTI